MQLLASFIEFIALAGLAFLGVDYQQDTACQRPQAELNSVEYVVIDEAGVGEQTIWFEQDNETANQARFCDANMIPEMIAAPANQTIFIQT